jgi:hypothetical protein
MTNCYRLEHIHKKGSFPLDDVVDATFIMTMENSSRHKHIYDHIVSKIPVSNIYIQFNQNFKKCEKGTITNAYQDQLHAFKNIFRLIGSLSYIMIIEDDAIISERFQDSEIQTDVSTFLKDNVVKCYNLGPCPYVPNPFYLAATHKHNIVSLSTHCCIYHTSYTCLYIEKKNPSYLNYLFFTPPAFDAMNSFSQGCYSYKIPLVYQTYFTKDALMNDILIGKIVKVFHDLVFINGVENGFDRVYRIGKVISFILLTTWIYLMILLYKKLIK